MRFIRKFTEEERVKIVEEALSYGSNAIVAAKYDIHQNQLCNWKSCYRKYGITTKPKQPKVLDDIIPDYKKECAILRKEKANLEIEVAILKDMLKKKEL